MREIIRTEGVVLKRRDFGETSRVVIVYTYRKGKVQLLAKGARRPKSKFGAALEPLTLGEYVFYYREAKDLYTLSEADIVRSYQRVREDAPRLVYGLACVEAADKILASPEVTETQRKLAAQTKLRGLGMLANIGDKKAIEAVYKLPEQLTEMGLTELAESAEAMRLRFEIRKSLAGAPGAKPLDELIETVKHLPRDKQLKVREFIGQLQGDADSHTAGPPLKGFLGALEHLNCDISQEDIAEARREMWGNFPRDVEI